MIRKRCFHTEKQAAIAHHHKAFMMTVIYCSSIHPKSDLPRPLFGDKAILPSSPTPAVSDSIHAVIAPLSENDINFLFCLCQTTQHFFYTIPCYPTDVNPFFKGNLLSPLSVWKTQNDRSYYVRYSTVSMRICFVWADLREKDPDIFVSESYLRLPGGIRTLDLQSRSLMHYPAMLRTDNVVILS